MMQALPKKEAAPDQESDPRKLNDILIQMESSERVKTYAAAGLPVFPCGPNKAPLTGHGFKDASINPRVIEGWIQKHPSCLWGVPTGTETFICLDIDDKHLFGASMLYRNACKNAGLLSLLERLPRQSTQNGGTHYLFKIRQGDPEIKNVKLATNHNGEAFIETRGKGGYIIVAPSTGYTLESGDLTEIPTLIREEVEDLFAVARSLSTKTPERPQERFEKGFEGTSPADDYFQRGEDHFAGILEKHGWVHVTGNNWRRPEKGQGVSATLGHHPGIWNVFTSSTEFEPKPYTLFKAYGILEHNGDGTAAARALIQEGFGKRVSPDAGSETTEEGTKRPEIIIRTHTERISIATTPRVWAVKDLIPARSLSAIVALHGQGKTLLSVHLAGCIASGDTFAKRKVTQGGVLYLCNDSAEDTERRLSSLPESVGRHILTAPEFPVFPDGIGALDKILKERPEINHVFVDTWDATRTHSDSGWAGQDSAIEDSCRHLRRLAVQRNVSTTIIHHATRADGGRARGSAVFDARMDTILHVAEKAGMLSTSCIKARAGKSGPVGTWRITTARAPGGDSVPQLNYAGAAVAERDADKGAILEAIRTGASSHADISALSGVPKGSIGRKLKKLIEDGFLTPERRLTVVGKAHLDGPDFTTFQGVSESGG